MVSRTPKPMMTRRSASDLKNRRPKRNISPKNLDDSVSGLSWKEERELKKALYASLQEARRQSRDDKPDDDESITDSREGMSTSQSRASLSSLTESKFIDENSCSMDSTQSFTEKRDTTRLEAKKTKYHAQRKFAVNSFTPICPEPSTSGVRATRYPSVTHQKKIHAQRKFAQGSTPTTPVEMPSKPKLKVSPIKLFPGRPKTEDFLTYLCFRGTSVLPPHLDLMNVKKDEADGEMSGANGRSGFTRESSPASSSSTSHQNEDSMDVPDVPMRVQTPSRKAARASASTPETARGFVNLRRGGKHSDSKLSPGSRKRLADSYGPSSKLKPKSPIKGHMGDRLTLKRKAMATLTAARRASPKKPEGVKKLRASVSDGELLKRKKLKLTQHNRKRDSECKGNHTPKSNGMRKRKSTGDLNENCMPSTPKRNKIENGSRFKSVLKCRAKETRGISNNKLKYLNSLETHPKKRLATSLRVKKTFKPHKPITRATTHLKQALKCAKMAANKKLKFVSKALQSGKSKRLTETSRRNGSEKKKLSSESSGSRSSLSSFSSDNSGEIRIKTDRFPGDSDPAAVVQCPTYYPSEEQFRDPILYIQSIQSEAEQYGMCKIVPPCNWKMDSRELDDIRFTTKIQFIHKMLHKWSPITEQLEYIKRLHNDAATNDEFQVPQIGGVEIDLVKLYELVQKYGGMKGTVGKEKKWLKIAEAMKIPKQADRVSKLYAAYCKYLLAYETLSEEETEQLQETVQTDRKKDEAEKHIPTCYKCVYKGKSQPLSSFHRAARNTQQLYDPESCNDPETIENDYWDIVEKSDDHVAVQGASLDTSIHGSMFPVRRDNMYARHGWNLHNFVESKGSILHHLGLIAGVTVPTLHIGMLYTTKCLSCNGHNLPTVQYLHQGPGLVWYAVPSQETDNLKEALKTVAPKLYRKEGFCLQKNSAMIPQSKLVENGVSLSRCVQTEREFVVVFPSVNYSNISLGYNMSESVHYGTQDWIPEGYQASKNLGMNHDIELFSMDAMLVFLARDSTTQDTTLALLLPYLEKVVEREITERKKLFEAGLKETEQLHDKLEKQAQKTDVLEEIIICDVSNKICYLSMVLNSHENSAFSLEQGLLHIQKRKNLKYCKLMYRYSEEELKALVKEVKSRLRGGNSSSPGASTSSPKRKTRKSNSDIKSSPASSTSSR
ncbi:protein Jumonji-like isoform X6 [Ruditapes philippinarum]|uniref:protein Jumonji-like isoform X6 n=1 Tax=Ruditapes philippinarum TaxID=129788 RepID=UPI00295B425B|nr:protein Jumonji-like isoform X6 [Ruditapes philippinarum]